MTGLLFLRTSDSKVSSVTALVVPIVITPFLLNSVSYELTAAVAAVPAVSALTSACSASQRSASMAAEQPLPAAVMACRYTWSTTSPQAKTPSIAVLVDRPLTSRYPSWVIGSWPTKSSLRGEWPIAMNAPPTGSTVSSPLLVFLTLRPHSLPSPTISIGSLSHWNLILGLAAARSAMIFDARSLSRRCTIVTVLPNRGRNSASSPAESPPPTTAMSCSRKKKPSQVAHHETPCPDSSFSPGTESSLYLAPVAMITALARYVSDSVFTPLGETVRSTSITSSARSSAPNRSACLRRWSIRSGPMTPSGKPGKFSTSVVCMSAPPAVTDPSKTRGESLALAA